MAATYLLTLYPACLGAAGMGLTNVAALLQHTKYHDSITDEAGKKLLDFPYNPNQQIKGRDEEVSKAFRTHRAYENSKEQCQITMPFMFVFSLYGGSIPYLSERTTRWVVGTTAAGWCIGNILYVTGYMKSNEGRTTGLRVRTLCARVFMYGSIVSLGCYGYKKLAE